jgi:hypothetical protein
MQSSLPSILHTERDFFAADHRAFEQAAAWRRRAARIRSSHLSLTPRELAPGVSRDRQALLKELARRPGQPMAPRRGHNPARYAPFDFTDSQILPATPPPGVNPFTFGPDAATGQIGASLGLGESDAEAITLSSRVVVGFSVFAGRGTYLIVAQAGIRGSMTIDTLSVGPYAEAYAGLRLSVLAGFRLPGQFVAEGEFRSTTDIGRLSAPSGVLDGLLFGTTSNVAGDARVATLLATVRGGPPRAIRSLVITVEAIQSVTSDHATAACQVEMSVGPVAIVSV